MKAISGKRLAKLLKGKGWELARITDPIHGNQSLKIGLQKNLMKLANINESEL